MTEVDRDRLVSAFQRELLAQVEVHAVNGAGRYRFALVSDKFVGLSQLARQDAAWRVVDKTLSEDAALDVSLLLAFAPEEVAEMSGQP
jgi:stress-induced morphogen